MGALLRPLRVILSNSRTDPKENHTMSVIHKAIQFPWSAFTGCRSTVSRLEMICETFRVPISLFLLFLSFLWSEISRSLADADNINLERRPFALSAAADSSFFCHMIFLYFPRRLNIWFVPHKFGSNCSYCVSIYWKRLKLIAEQYIIPCFTVFCEERTEG